MRLLHSDYDQFTGMTEETWYDDHTNQMTLRRLQDVEHTIALNKIQFNSHAGKMPSYADSTGGAHHVARIPFVIIEKWLREDGFDWYSSTDKERRKKLNNPDNRKLLVRPGKL